MINAELAELTTAVNVTLANAHIADVAREKQRLTFLRERRDFLNASREDQMMKLADMFETLAESVDADIAKQVEYIAAMTGKPEPEPVVVAPAEMKQAAE